MSFTALTRLSLSIGSLAIVLAAASPARAQACKDTTQCPQGFVCEISATPTPAVDTGTKSSEAGAAPADLIAPATGGYCQPAPCTKDSECGAGMLCHTETREQCSGGTAPAIACAPNSDCAKPQPTPETCTKTTESRCVYKWQLPCSTDVECGAGFNCMPSVSTSGCAGGSGVGSTPGTGSAAPSSGAMDLRAPLPAADGGTTCTPTTTTSFPGYCQPKATTCTTNTDCPTAWTCGTVAVTSPGVPASSGPTNAADGGAANVASPLPARPAPEETTKICQSPLGYGGTAGRNETATDNKGDGTSGPQAQPTSPGGGGQKPPAESAASPQAGCTIGGNVGGGSSIALVAFGLVGLALARRRRS